MSRSRKKNPFCKIAGKSDKKDKTTANKRFRRLSKILIEKGEIPFMHIREVSDTWSFSSDGLACMIRGACSTREENLKCIKRFMRK